MEKLKFAMLGAGFWARFQLAGWLELDKVECVAIYNRTIRKAEELAHDFGVPNVYADTAELFRKEKLDFVDIVTDVNSHSRFVNMASEHRLPVVCQKPMAPSLKVAEEMVRVCRERSVPLFINENFRWQTPIRQLKETLNSGEIGIPFRARVDMISGFPVFKNQPFLGELEQFILTDLGSHILDVCRFLFGEADSLFCKTHRIHQNIRGEDVATVVASMGGKTTVIAEMAYAENPLERECFPETLVFVEGDKGSVELCPGFWIRVTKKEGTLAKRFAPPRYSWADPEYDVVHSSIVPCQANILQGLRGEGTAETTGDDNLKTIRLVFAAYESAQTAQVAKIRQSGSPV